MSARGSAFWTLVDRSDDAGCWPWLGSLTYQGYGQWSSSKHSTERAHRVAYELLVGPIPDGLVIDHLCRRRDCVNPAHMEPVTNRENVLRGIGPTAQMARRSHCGRGHEFTPENTHWRPKNQGRRCRACMAIDSALYRSRGRAS